jgi:hypothetical protein
LANFFNDAFELKNYFIRPDKLSGLENYYQIFKGLISGGGCGRGKIFAISIVFDRFDGKRLNERGFKMQEEIRGCVTFYIFRSLLVSYSQ